MASTTHTLGAPASQTLAPSRSHSHGLPSIDRPLALWHLLSLDAPTVAITWTSFIAAANHVHLPPSSLIAMFLAVWMLYAADRLLDARALQAKLPPANPLHVGHLVANLEPRHFFHHRYRPAFLVGLILASIALAVLLPHLLASALHLYFIEGVLLVAYFLLIHATSGAHRLPKELAVGLFFAAAVFIPTITRSPDLRLRLVAQAVLLAAVCILNCLFIYAWEHRPAVRTRPALPPHPATRFALRHLTVLSNLTVACALGVVVVAPVNWLVAGAVALSAAFLLILHLCRRHFQPTTLRAVADLALLAPILLLPFLR